MEQKNKKKVNKEAKKESKKVIISFRDICVDFSLSRGVLHAVDHVDLDVYEGEIIGIVGESGSGKTTLSSTALNLVSSPGKISNGQVMFRGDNILDYTPDQTKQFNWKGVSMVFQAAQNSMNPILRVKDIFMETALAHDAKASEEQVINKAKELMSMVRLKPEQVLPSYPHQLSGGMKQRTIIALSLLLDPKVLVLDEPTTALDVITQAYIMNILKEIHDRLGITMIFLTHDIAVLGKIADRMAVMYGGQVVEIGTCDEIFYESSHPYTHGLIKAAPSLLDDVTKRRAIPGSPPDLINISSTCRFAKRCYLYEKGVCNSHANPVEQEIAPGHKTRCPEWEGIVKNA